ncbi:MAG: hypothetical protein AMXMBFR12_00240 [Candidatus Babeliales bacterium]
MKKLLILTLLFPFFTQSMHQPKSLQELVALKVSKMQLKSLPLTVQNHVQDVLNKKLLEIIKASGWKILKDNDAQYRCNLTEIQAILIAGADPNYINSETTIPILNDALECIKPYAEWQASSHPETDRYEVLKLLLSHGANSDIRTNPMLIPFLWAAKKNIHATQIFLEHGADPNQIGCQGCPLTHNLLFDICAYTNGEPVKVAQLLLQYGADPLHPRIDKNAKNALWNAQEWRNTHLISLYEKGGMQKIL